MSPDNSSPEKIPYSIVVEGSVDASRLPKLIEVLSKISTEQTVSYRFGEAEPMGSLIYESEVVSKDDPVVVKRAWDRLVTTATTTEDFPLQRKFDDKKHTVYLEGNAEAAVQWLLNDKRIKFNTGSISLLRRFLDPEFDMITYQSRHNPSL